MSFSAVNRLRIAKLAIVARMQPGEIFGLKWEHAVATFVEVRSGLTRVLRLLACSVGTVYLIISRLNRKGVAKRANCAGTTMPRGSAPVLLTKSESARFRHCPVDCLKLPDKITSLADYISVISTTITSEETFWFRGHPDMKWALIPSALRYPSEDDCGKALALVADFKRVAEMKIDRPPQAQEQLKWAQLAQHYGLPTPLLDWTESATMALYFACDDPASDGMVYLMNPVELNRLSNPKLPRILDAHTDAELVEKYLPRLDGTPRKPPRNPIAVNPIWNSARLMAQKGVFTLHGKIKELNKTQAPSLVALKILRECKAQLRAELERIGVDEMTIFPELDHACRYLKRKAGLP
jgi:hypothetical protein